MNNPRLQAELDWWRGWLSPATLPRLLGVYGMRYLPFWFMDFQDLGRVCDIGSGPISAAWIAVKFDHLICVDPNARDYRPILDLMDMTEDEATDWYNSWKTLLADPFIVPILYGGGSLLGKRLALDQTLLPDSGDLEVASFDTVLCLNTLDHVEDPLAVLKECHRLLHPSGKLLLWTHLRDEDPGDGLHVALNAAQVHQLAAEAGLVHRRSQTGYCETQFGGDPVGDPAFWGTFTR